MKVSALLKDDCFLRQLESRLLLFTLFVVLSTCVSFALGGSCSAWQWYVPFVLASCWGRTWYRCSALAFVSIVAVMWLVAPFWLDSYANCDTPAYHLPMVRLLTFGWNPFSDPEAHGICSALGLDWWGMRPYHVAYCSKPAAVFSAVSFFFVGDPYAMTYPLPFLLLIAVCVSAFRVFKTTIAVPLLMMYLLWRFLPTALFVDCSLMLASAGLILTMYADLRDNRRSYISLIGYGFWVMNLKLPGMLAAFVLFSVFAIAILRKNCNRSTCIGLAFIAIVLALASCLASFNPYGTSFRDKGHPLYPFKTVNNDKWPVRDMCMDFKVANPDAEQMGRIGALVNAYVSPRLARAYYNWKLRRTDFKPHKLVWDYRWHNDPNAVDGPIRTRDRVLVFLAVLGALAMPNLRMLGIGLVLLIVGFPFEQIGFLRYQPWIPAFFCMGVAALTSQCLSRWKHLVGVAGLAIALIIMFTSVNQLKCALGGMIAAASGIDMMPDKIYSCYEQPRPLLPVSFRHAVAEFLDRKKTHSSNLELRNRQSGTAGNHQVICIGDEEVDELGLIKSPLGYFVASQEPEWARTNCQNWFSRRLSDIHLLVAWYCRRIRLLTN